MSARTAAERADRPGLIALAERLHEAECERGDCASVGHPLPVSRAQTLYDLGVRVEAEASAGLRAALQRLRGHTPTAYPDGPHGELIHCACGYRDHMGGWWAHIVVDVIEHQAALAAQPASSGPTNDLSTSVKLVDALPQAGLNVERLIDALLIALRMRYTQGNTSARKDAAAIAAAYASAPAEER